MKSKKDKLLESLRELIRKEIADAIRKDISEYGMESIYYNHPGGFEQATHAAEPRIQRFDNVEKWKVVAMQLGAVIQDRGDDWIAVLPNQDKLGTFSKLNKFGTLTLYV